MKPDYTISDTICLWLSSGRKIGSKKLKQALNLAKKASIFRPFFKEIDYQTLTRCFHPVLLMEISNDIARNQTQDLTIYRA